MELSPFLLCSLGLIFILLEIFFVPGFGFVGVLGFVFLIWGSYRYSEIYGVGVAITIFAVCLAVCAGSFVLFFRSPASRWIVHRDQFKSKEAHHFMKVGQRGRSFTPLFPSGKAVFVIDGKEQRVDVSSAGEFIDAHHEIEVFLVEGNRIFVKPVNGKVG